MPMQKYVLYRAVNSEGHEVTDFERAITNSDALNQLCSRGYTDIRLCQDAALIPSREDLKDLTPKQLKRVASRELSVLQNPDSGFWLPALRDQGFLLLSMALLFSMSIFFEQVWLAVLTVLASVALFAVLLITSRHLKNYNRALRAFAVGDSATFFDAKAALSKLNDTNMSADLTVKAASLLAAQGRSAKALQYMNQLQAYHHATSRGMHENRLASIYFAMQETETYRELNEQSYRLSGWNDSFGLDYALALVRTGHMRDAGKVLKTLRTDCLPEFARPFYYWVAGAIQSSLDPEKASESFDKALSAFRRLNRDIALPSLAACTSDYLAFVRPEAKEGSVLFLAVRPVLKFHEQPDRFSWLENHYGTPDCSSDTD